jgi:FtsP/CotA-like multicopper oxidase with cupredoxin domain
MGLFGAVTKNAAANQAYAGAATAFDSESIIFYTEVDPVLHNQVANGEYGTTGMTSTINYNPAYFLVNGADELSNTIIVNQTKLMRFINMGLKTHVPVLHNEDFKIIAEDGHEYQYPKNQYSITIAAGQTKDALFTPTVSNDYPMFDRILNLTNKRAPVVVALAVDSATTDTVTSPGSLVTVLQVGTNADTDNILDRKDNCLLVSNPNQVDTDNDGFGNACDADLNNDGVVSIRDIPLFKRAYSDANVLADFNGDGRVNVRDIPLLKKMFFSAPGPTGVAT